MQHTTSRYQRVHGLLAAAQQSILSLQI